MNRIQKPRPENGFLCEHVELLLSSFHRLTGRKLINYGTDPVKLAEGVFNASLALVSHNTLDDPLFNYANKTALRLFEMSWEEFTSLPSRESAEAVNREERARLLKEVAEKGFIDDYSGIRISSTGRRFRINNAVVWNVFDELGTYHGQAATFSEWVFL